MIMHLLVLMFLVEARYKLCKQQRHPSVVTTATEEQGCAGCISLLVQVTIPDHVTSIQENAFEHCLSLGFILFSQNLVYIRMGFP